MSTQSGDSSNSNGSMNASDGNSSGGARNKRLTKKVQSPISAATDAFAANILKLEQGVSKVKKAGLTLREEEQKLSVIQEQIERNLTMLNALK